MIKQARIKLTAWYLIIIMTISIVFSIFVYSDVSRNANLALSRHNMRVMIDGERDVPRFRNLPSTQRFNNQIYTETILEIQERTLKGLITLNITLLLFSSLLGYWLSGRTLRPIEDMIEKQKRFTADAAHELKTPLTSMKTNVQVTLRNSTLSVTQAKATLGIVLEDINTLNLLIKKLITQSKFESKENSSSVEEINLKNLFNNVIDEMKPRTKEKRIKVIYDNK
jgi:two-component system, OmpR family, sensor histidine kinase CiaH